MSYPIIAHLSDIPADRPLRVYVGERVIALFRLDGEVFALDDHCPHKAGPLGEGHCENGQVFCPLHGWAFDIKTGACADVPARPATCIPVRVEDGKVFLR
jgi:NAD(P)H-dependent nitrite reductase small subunit